MFPESYCSYGFSRFSSLLAAAVSSEVAGRVRSTLDRLEAQQYGGGDVDLDGLVSELEGLITEVDRGLRGRG